MVALLDKPEADGVAGIVKAIAVEYPQVNLENNFDTVDTLRGVFEKINQNQTCFDVCSRTSDISLYWS